MGAKIALKSLQSDRSNLSFWRRHGRRIVIVAVVIFFAMLVVLFMLPMWMQTPQGQIYALEHIKRQTGLQISARNWSLGWFSPTTFEAVQVTAPNGSSLTADYLITDLSLLDYLRGHWDLGTTTVTAPHISLSPSDLAPLTQTVAKARGLRGSIALKGGSVSLLTSTPGRSLECSILEAQIPIASSDSAVHATFRGQTLLDGQPQDINITTTLPPVENWLSREAWFKTHLNIFAGGVSTAVVAEWIGLPPSWQATFGPTVSITAVCSPTSTNPNQQDFTLKIAGASGNARFAGQFIEQDHETYLVIRPPLGTAEFSGRLEGALPRLLAWLNPTLSSATSGQADISVQSMEIPTRRWQACRISGILSTSQVKLAPDGVLGGVLTVAGIPMPAGAKPLPVVLPPVRFNVDQGQVNCADFQILLNNKRIRMTGNISLSGQVNLYAQVPAPSAGPLSASRITVPVRGTVDAPAVSAAE